MLALFLILILAGLSVASPPARARAAREASL